MIRNQLGVRSGIEFNPQILFRYFYITILSIYDMATANLKRPELKLGGNISEHFKNFELRFHDYCIQANYRDLDKDPETEKAEHYKKPLLEIAALRSATPDEALQVIRYTIDPHIAATDKNKPWIWMNKLREHLALPEVPL